MHEARNASGCCQKWERKRIHSPFNVVISRIFSLVAGMVRANLEQPSLTHVTLLFAEPWCSAEQPVGFAPICLLL